MTAARFRPDQPKFVENVSSTATKLLMSQAGLRYHGINQQPAAWRRGFYAYFRLYANDLMASMDLV